MRDVSEIFAEIKERLSRATKGPWRFVYSAHEGGAPRIITALGGEIAETFHYGATHEDAEFIAHARTDVEMLLDMVINSLPKDCLCEKDDSEYYCYRCARVKELNTIARMYENL